jgi:hypothetical protein
MRYAQAGTILVAVAVTLAGCSASSIIDRMPGAIGEPADAPARPADDAYQYPAVHDMPPPRSDTLLTDEQQVKMERDLQNVRDRQEGRTGAKPAKKPANTAKTAPQDASGQQPAGEARNP